MTSPLIAALSLLSYASAQTPCSCIRTFKPVCGSDGKTYNSDCYLKCATGSNPALTKAYPGACCPPPNCPDFHQYVCASNGQTYENECLYRYAACIARRKEGMILQIESHGRCTEDAPQPTSTTIRRAPTTVTSPVASCHLDCGTEVAPVCDRGGKTHMNKCMLDYSNCLLARKGKPPVEISHFGQCKIVGITKAPCPRRCPVKSKPVCGSDGVTYKNKCLLQRANCASETSVKLRSHGPCNVVIYDAVDSSEALIAAINLTRSSSASTDLDEMFKNRSSTEKKSSEVVAKFKCRINACPRVLRPVCGSDHSTYPSICNLRNEACKRDRRGDPRLSVRYEGPCHPGNDSVEITTTTLSPDRVCPETCPEHLIVPVCDQEGNYYPNDCLMKMSSCKREASGLPRLRMGVCQKVTPAFQDDCNLGCTRIYQPVCDNLGKTHSNRCLFDYEQCIRRQAGIRLELVHKGECVALDKVAPQTPPPPTAPPQPSLTTLKSIALCDIDCVDIESPVCDDYNVTHINPCEFEKAKCLVEARGGPILKIVKHQTCGYIPDETIIVPGGAVIVQAGDKVIPEKKPPCEFRCSSEYAPLCDNRNVTHPNLCVFEFNRCREISFHGRSNMTVARNKSCETPIAVDLNKPPQVPVGISERANISSCAMNCSDKAEEVCDKDGRTHVNLCHFSFAKCQSLEVKGVDIEIAHDGACVDFQLQEFSRTIKKKDNDVHPPIRILPQTTTKGTISRANASAEIWGRTDPTSINVTTAATTQVVENITSSSKTTPKPSASKTTKATLRYVKATTIFPVTPLSNEKVILQKSIELKKKDSPDNAPTRSRLVLEPSRVDSTCAATKCSDQKDPVCDNKGRTHLNSCIFDRVKCSEQATDPSVELYIAHFGECKPSLSFGNTPSTPTVSSTSIDPTIMCDPTCSDEYDPVCDSNGSTHVNTCRFKYISCLENMIQGQPLEVAHKGHCNIPTQRNCSTKNGVFDNDFNAVCATDGVMVRTFGSLAALNEEMCRLQKPMYILEFSECQGDGLSYDPCTMDCTVQDTTPMCDQQKTTHTSLCEYNKVSCLSFRSSGRLQYIAARGSCASMAEQFPIDVCGYVCTQEYLPVCDSSGTSYNNLCLYKHAKCERLRTDSTAMSYLIHWGLCADNLDYAAVNPCLAVCKGGYEPVCGTDGKTYSNTCLFNKVACTTAGLEIAFQGNCSGGPPTGPIALIEAPAISEEIPDVAPTVDLITHQEHCDATCPDVNEPLCDNLNETHRSPCQFNFAACMTKKATGQRLFYNHRGYCTIQSLPFSPTNDPSCQWDCTSEQDTAPICDGQNRVHPSECAFRRLSCQLRQATGRGLSVGRFGPCEESPKAKKEYRNVPAAPVRATSTGYMARNNGLVFSKVDNGGVEFSIPSAAPLRKTVVAPAAEIMKGEPCSSECTGVPDAPVCDTTGKTHENLCTFSYESCMSRYRTGTDLMVARPGRCDGSDIIPQDCRAECRNTFKPVCGSNNKTYANLCYFKKSACITKMEGKEPMRLKHFGTCEETASYDDSVICADTTCPPIINLLCDSDGGTHDSPCQFNKARCQARRKGQILTIAHYGACSKACPGTCDSAEVSYVCDSQFRTLPSMCHYRKQQCQDEAAGQPPADLLFPGKCDDCIRDCPGDYQPICSSMGSTHPNRCQFEVANCIYMKKYLTSLEALYQGECCERDCTDAPQDGPLCDSKGATHATSCNFEIARCTAERSGESIGIKHRGSCRPNEYNEIKKQAVIKERSQTAESVWTLSRSPSTRRTATPTTEPVIRWISDSFANASCPIICDDVGGTAICGSDGVTYPSLCQLQRASCSASNSIALEHEGACCGKLTSESECPNQYDPVCDTKGQTHANLCYFSLAKCQAYRRDHEVMEMQYSGECCTHECSPLYQPVCDSLNRTHINYCYFDIATCLARTEGRQLTVSNMGHCKNTACNTECPETFDPVCGTDDNTYANLCKLRIASCLTETSGRRLDVKHNGTCCDGDCGHEYRPVCDSEGRTHINPCAFDHYKCRTAAPGLSIARKGPCCDQPCTEEYSPVCDTRGNTHANRCYFRRNQCRLENAGEGIALAYDGECCQLTTPCPQLDPVCGTDGRTYQTHCVLDHAGCMLSRRNMPSVDVAYRGECCRHKECADPKSPVCDTLQQTHASDCDFRNFRCVYDNTHNSTVDIDYAGTCCKNSCKHGGSPVCDQNGKSYGNRCLFDLATCTP